MDNLIQRLRKAQLSAAADVLELRQREIEHLRKAIKEAEFEYDDDPIPIFVLLQGVSSPHEAMEPESSAEYLVAYAVHDYDGVRNIVKKESCMVLAPNAEKAEEIVLGAVRRLHRKSVVSLGARRLPKGGNRD